MIDLFVYYRIKYKDDLFYDKVGYCKYDKFDSVSRVCIPELNNELFVFAKKNLEEIDKTEYMKEIWKLNEILQNKIRT